MSVLAILGIYSAFGRGREQLGLSGMLAVLLCFASNMSLFVVQKCMGGHGVRADLKMERLGTCVLCRVFLSILILDMLNRFNRC